MPPRHAMRAATQQDVHARLINSQQVLARQNSEKKENVLTCAYEITSETMSYAHPLDSNSITPDIIPQI